MPLVPPAAGLGWALEALLGRLEKRGLFVLLPNGHVGGAARLVHLPPCAMQQAAREGRVTIKEPSAISHCQGHEQVLTAHPMPRASAVTHAMVRTSLTQTSRWH